METGESVADTQSGVALADGAGAPQPELRTFLFADVRGYTRFTQERGDHDAATLVGKFEALTRQTVRVRGGTLLEMRGDEALAVFNSARQALRAAVDLQARYAVETESDPDFPLRVGIGIEAGEAIPVDEGYRGEALNLASRLCNLAGPGEVLATEGVVYLGRRVPGIAYAERGLIPIKGFAEPVRVIRVMPAETTVTPRAAAPTGDQSLDGEHGENALPIGGFLGALPSGVLVAREGEWNRIMALLEMVMQGSGRLVLLSGEPGIGKTRLAQEVTLKARHWGFLVGTGRCYEQEQTMPYYPFLEALVMLYEASHPSIRAEVPRRWPYLGRLLPDQVGIVPISSDGQEDQYLLFRAVTGFIEAVAEMQPVAILLDDLHWADDSSLRLLQHLARYTRANRVFLFGTFRDVEVNRQHPLETVLLDLSREQLVEEVQVRRLNRAGTAALLAEIMGDKEDLSDLAELVYRRTEGNAFFIQEMLHTLVERGDLVREDGRWEGRDISTMEVPKSIRSAIGQRLSRLEEQAQETLREASVLGQEFSFDDLVALGKFAPGRPSVVLSRAGDTSGWTEDQVEGVLEQALQAGLLREAGPDTYAFNHALTQQALYAELSPRRKKRLHLAAGRALELLPQQERERRAGELAWHFLQGDELEQALHYTLLAGKQAESVFANREADRQYRTALELARELGDVPCEVEALERLAGVLIIAAQYDQALEALEQAASLYRDFGNHDREAFVVAQIGNVYFLQDRSSQGVERLRPLADSLEREGNGGFGLGALQAALGRLYSDVGDHQKQLAAAERALELAHALDDQPERERLILSAEVTRSDALWRLGQRDDALRGMEELIPRAEAASDLDTLARALANAATYHARRGEFDKDRLYLDRMLTVAELRGDRGQMVLALMALNTNAFVTGRWAEAREYLERAEGIISELGATRLALWPVTARAWMSLREGDLESAVTYAEQMFELLQGSEDAAWRRNVLRILAECALLTNRADVADSYLKPVLEETGWERDSGFLPTLAWMRVGQGLPQEARDLAVRAVEQARLKNRPNELASALTMQGVAAGVLAQWDEAERVFAEADELTLRMRFPFERGRVLYWDGVTLARRNRSEDAAHRLEEALAVFEQLGATADGEMAQRALDEIERG